MSGWNQITGTCVKLMWYLYSTLLYYVSVDLLSIFLFAFLARMCLAIDLASQALSFMLQGACRISMLDPPSPKPDVLEEDSRRQINRSGIYNMVLSIDWKKVVGCGLYT